MRVLPLTPAAQEKVLASRRDSSREAERVASRIVDDVRRRGDSALFAYTKKFDRVALTPKNVWVPRAELKQARPQSSRRFSRRHRSCRAQHSRRRAQAETPRMEYRSRARRARGPARARDRIDRLLSSRRALLARLHAADDRRSRAGGRRAPDCRSKPAAGPALLAAAERLGVRSVARVGGAQAVAALAYGTRSIPRVDKIFGPGNRFVTAAKRLVSADCAIDMLAGPTEAIVFADRGNPQFIAADLIAQAEHDPDAISIFVTTSSRLGKAVACGNRNAAGRIA